MRNEIPILAKSNHTPEFEGFGLFAGASRFHGGTDSSAVWVHGVLALPPEASVSGSGAEWLESLNITIVGEANQLPQTSTVLGNRVPIQDHFFKAELADGSRCQILPFSFNLLDCFGLQLYEDNFYIHVSARQYCSVPIRILRSPESTSGFLDQPAGQNPQIGEIDLLIQAYDVASTGGYSDAAALFEAALKNEEARSDLDRPNLFNAAFCAGQAAIISKGEVADTLLAQSAGWMADDNAVKKSALETVQNLLSTETEAAVAAQLENKRFQLLKDMGLSNLSRELGPSDKYLNGD